jgi:ketosteroid isomerase-like protein
VSAENVARIKAIYEAVNRRDLESAVAQLDPDFELDSSRSINPDRGTGIQCGREPVAAAIRNLMEPWEEFEMFADEYVEAGEHVVRIGGLRARGRGSGVETVARGAQLWEFRDGTPVAMRQFQSKEDALAAAGLE